MQSDRVRALARRPRRDAGMTLPELLITVVVLGIIMTVLSASIIVTLRQNDSTAGRVNVARWEQNIDLYLPNDLASAESVDQDPDASPCDTTCPPNVVLDGSNALMLTWTTKTFIGTQQVTTITNVSYYFGPSDEPGFNELRRIECNSTNGSPWSCEVVIIIRDIELLTPWAAGDPVPPSIVQVSEPLAPDATGEGQIDDGTTRKDANRVIVTINGGGSSSGTGGGENRISVTAGGTERSVIPADSIINAPSFTEARSRCGGPIALIVDDSGSIGGAMDTVRQGVRRFVETFAGTPTQIQIVRFDSTSGVVGGGGAWTKYYDMADETQVTQLLATLNSTSNPPFVADGGTNWEDAWFRAVYQQSGTDLLQTQPELAVFFTDGEPTFERLRTRASGGGDIPGQPLPGAGWPTYSGGYYSNGNEYSQVAFNRAKYIVDQVRGSTRVIGVGVGSAFSSNSNWVESPGAGWHWRYERGYRRYQKAPRIYEQAAYQSRVNFEKGSAYQSRVNFERGSGWQSRANFEQITGWQSRANFEQGSTPQSRTDFEQGSGWQSRANFEQGSGWQSRANFEQGSGWQSRANFQQGSGWQSRVNFQRLVAGTWQPTTPTLYYTNNVNNGSGDGWRINSTDRAWYSVTAAEYLNYSADIAADWQITTWSPIGPTAYYTNNTTTDERDSYRINSTDRAWYSVTAAEYLNYSANIAADWQITTWSPIGPTAYYTNNTTTDERDSYRINSTDRAWYSVTAAEYLNYSANIAADWQITTWSPIGPTAYYTNNTTTDERDSYRINGTRTYYGVTAQEYLNHSANLPADWRIQTWTDISPTAYYAGNTTGDERDSYRINTADRGYYTVTTQELQDYAALNADDWRFATWSPIGPTLYYTNNTTSTDWDGYRVNGTRAYYSVTQAEYNAYRSLLPSDWQASAAIQIGPTAYYASNTTADDSDGYRVNGTRSYYTVTQSEYLSFSGNIPADWRIQNWTAIGPTEYYGNNSTGDERDSYRINGTRTYYGVTVAEYNAYSGFQPADWRGSWNAIGPTEYYANNTTGDESDGYRINGTRSYYAVTNAEYNAYASASPSNWRIQAWNAITATQYNANNTTPDDSDGFRTRLGSWVWISTAEYNANNTTADETDGYRDAGKQYVNDDDDAMDWEPTTTQSEGGGYRRVKDYTEPYTSYDPAVEVSKSNEKILSRLITGHENAVKWNNGVPGNASVADLFVLPDFTNFSSALQSVALAECGGTMTVSTKVDGQRPPDPFTYQNTKVTNAAGADLQPLATVVTTSRSFPTGTFDFATGTSAYLTVDVLPLNLAQLTAYEPVGWSCKAGVTPITSIQNVPITDAENPGWYGVRVRVAANQAVSCTLNVTFD